nr:hypothetical protein CJ211_04660 [Gardnerella vaginalis]PMC53627.1 hypothetical protein CJ210_01190 [Gardnerella vaginalis]
MDFQREFRSERVNRASDFSCFTAFFFEVSALVTNKWGYTLLAKCGFCVSNTIVKDSGVANFLLLTTGAYFCCEVL